MSGRLALCAVVLALAGCAPRDPARAYERGELDDAARGYARLLTDSPGSPLVHYNLGAVLLRQERYEDARPHLEAAGRAADREVRQAAHYNLGNSHLEPVFAEHPEGRGREDHLRRAIAAYKRALLLDSGDEDAKWNLELARRMLEEERNSPRPDPSAGGGGGSGGDREQGRDDPDPRPASETGPSPRLSRAAAERILRSAELQELGVQREKLRKAQPPSHTAH